jgi:hypothetical protein
MHGFIPKLLNLYDRTIQCQQLKHSFGAKQSLISINGFQAHNFQDTEQATKKSLGKI